MMDFLSMEKVNTFILSVPIFPYLWIPHALLMTLSLRSTLGPRWQEIARENPLSCLLLGMLYIYPGGILAAVLQGEPVLSFLMAGPQLYCSLSIWYLMFYGPADFLFKAVKILHIQPVLLMLQDWQRVGLVMSGIEGANKQNNQNYFIYPVVIGILKSSGFMFVKYMEVGILNGIKTGFKVPNQATKTMILAAVLIQLQNMYSLFPTTVTELYCLLVMFAVMMRAVTFIFKATDWDPYCGAESIVCSLIYGNCNQQLDKEQDKKKKKQ